MEKDKILEALDYIAASSLNYQEWINIGMALKNEGYPCSAWNDWSAKDAARYKAGECERKWAGFNGSANPVTGGTIVQMAKNNGFTISRFEGDGCMDWDDVIEYDGDGSTLEVNKIEKPTEQLIRYLEALFNADERVGYVTNDVWQDSEGKYLPSKGVYDRTAGELIESLKKYPDDLGATIGDWKEECGAWIRFNPVDGGVKNENVTRFNYALVESDDMPLAEQDALYRKFELPIAALVYSGGKSIHAIVRVDAQNQDEYRKRVDFLYDFLERHDLNIDKQNRNPSRLSRMPGVTRNGKQQTLLETNIGRKSWIDWLDYVEGANDELPELTVLSKDLLAHPPVLPEQLIEGVLRCGHKMLISGSSKAGKSYLLMELCVALSEGLNWVDRFKCRKSKVLYVNLEIDPASCINRFIEIYKAMKLTPKHSEDIVIWNLRGHAIPLDVSSLIKITNSSVLRITGIGEN